jgi:hypothetical protein
MGYKRYNRIYLNKQVKHIHFSATCHWHQSSDSYLILSNETCLQNEQKWAHQILFKSLDLMHPNQNGHQWAIRGRHEAHWLWNIVVSSCMGPVFWFRREIDNYQNKRAELWKLNYMLWLLSDFISTWAQRQVVGFWCRTLYRGVELIYALVS